MPRPPAPAAPPPSPTCVPPWLALTVALSLPFCADAPAAATTTPATTTPKHAPDTAVAASLWEHLVACKAAGHFRIDKPQQGSACPSPAVGAAVDVTAGSDDSPRLTVGGYRIPLTARTGCSFTGEGCHLDPATGTYVSATAALSVAADGTLTVTVGPRAVTDFKAAACPNAFTVQAVRAAATDPCEPVGTWDMAGPAARTAGACDIPWPRATFRIDEAGAGYSVDWPGTALKVEGVDAKTCTLRLTHAPAFFHGVERKLALTLTIRGDDAAGALHDELLATSDFGETCQADLVFVASRRTGTVALSPTCGVAAPYVCGDGKCDAAGGETCGNCANDCLCGSGEACAVEGGTPARCAAICDPWKATCAAGSRCSRVEHADGKGPVAVCLPAGAKTVGLTCASDSQCAAGLVCFGHKSNYIGWVAGQAICVKPCTPILGSDVACGECRFDPDDTIGGCLPECDATVAGTCGKDSFCWKQYPLKPGHCYPRPPEGLSGPGGDCANYNLPIRCEETLTCVLAAPHNYCSPPCKADADCPKTLPSCGKEAGKSLCLKKK